MAAITRRRSPDWIGFSLYFVLVQLAALAMRAADWTDDLFILPAISMFALAAGIALARSVFKPLLVSLFAVVYGLFTLGWQFLDTFSEALSWMEKLQSFAGRVGVFFNVLVRGEKNEDPLMFVLLMGILFWIISIHGSWAFFRKHHFWRGVIPAGVVLLVNSYFYIGRSNMELYIASFMLILLLLVVWVHIENSQRSWKQIKAQIPAGAVFQISRTGAMIAFTLVVVSWGGPAFMKSGQAWQLWQSVSRPWRTLRDRVGEAFGDLRSPVTVIYDAFGDTLSLNAGAEPSAGIVMEVEALQDPSKSGRFYWRTRSFAVFENNAWTGTPGEEELYYPDDENIPVVSYLAREELEVTILLKQHALRTLNLPAQPLWFNRPATLMVTYAEEELVDVSMASSQALVYEGERIRARAAVPVPTADELREASGDYPAWVTAQYLQLPETTTDRMAELAESITSAYDNPYDKTMAITMWLRQNINYEREIDPPPELVEPIDWFLFDYQEGFCNWYATAEILMLRLSGIPARMAVGYAEGSHDPIDEIYVVSGSDAHAWPEVFFPEYGWIEFEPTGNQPILVRPEDPARLLDENQYDNYWTNMARAEMLDAGSAEDMLEEGLDEAAGAIPDVPTNYGIRTTWTFLAGLAAVLVLTGLWMRLDPLARIAFAGVISGGLKRVGVQPPLQLERMGEMALTTTGLIYARWSKWMRRLGIELHASQTPFERAQLYEQRYPAAAESGWVIARAYAGERYGGFLSDIWEIRQSWRDLQLQLWKDWFRNGLDQIRALFRKTPASGE